MFTLTDGSPWLVLACFLMFIGVVIGLYTEHGSGIAHHPYTSPHDGGELASDLPPESLGRAALESSLWRRHDRATLRAHDGRSDSNGRTASRPPALTVVGDGVDPIAVLED